MCAYLYLINRDSINFNSKSCKSNLSESIYYFLNRFGIKFLYDSSLPNTIDLCIFIDLSCLPVRKSNTCCERNFNFVQLGHIFQCHYCLRISKDQYILPISDNILFVLCPRNCLILGNCSLSLNLKIDLGDLNVNRCTNCKFLCYGIFYSKLPLFFHVFENGDCLLYYRSSTIINRLLSNCFRNESNILWNVVVKIDR